MSHGCPPDGNHFGDHNLYRLDELTGSLGSVEAFAVRDNKILSSILCEVKEFVYQQRLTNLYLSQIVGETFTRVDLEESED